MSNVITRMIPKKRKKSFLERALETFRKLKK